MEDLQRRREIKKMHYPDRPTKPEVIRLEKQCSASPSSWIGESLMGDPIYIRYRHGKMLIHIGGIPLGDSEPHTKIEFEWESDGHPSEISEAEMKETTQMFLTFND